MDGVLIPWVIASTVLLFVAAYWVYTLEKRLKALEARYAQLLALSENLDQATLADFLARMGTQDGRLDAAETALQEVRAILPHTIQGYGIIRYQAFPNVGGDQSFSLALVDSTGSGALITSLHGRNETRIYAKPLMQWRASYSLSNEEQEALSLAREMTEA